MNLKLVILKLVHLIRTVRRVVDQNDEPVIKLVDEVLKLERKPLPYNKLVMVVLVQFWMNLKLVMLIHVLLILLMVSVIIPSMEAVPHET